MPSKIDILLSTYNGEKFLAAQIDSLINQTYADWKLLIRDDVSNDNTVSLIKKYQSKYPDKIVVLDNQAIKKGVVGSFELLLQASDASYVAFCDQDDVWNKNKLRLQMEAIEALEQEHDASMPILLHTDLSVVDDQLALINESFWKYQHLMPDKMSSLPRMLVQNCVTGCTVVINRSLIRSALPFPEGVIMHDWWLALIAVSEGFVCEIKTSTVKYRQHDNNDTGAKRWGLGFIIRSIGRGRDSQRRSLIKTCRQAEALTKLLSGENKRVVEHYISLYNCNWFLRRLKIFRMGFFKYGVIRNLAMFLYV